VAAAAVHLAVTTLLALVEQADFWYTQANP
jgi:hypothetical protein